MNKTPAQLTLSAISNTFFGGKNYDETTFYECDEETSKDGVLTGTVHEIVAKGQSGLIGKFRINADGKIKDFPGLPQSFIEEINGPEEVLVEKVVEPIKPKKRGRKPKSRQTSTQSE